MSGCVNRRQGECPEGPSEHGTDTRRRRRLLCNNRKARRVVRSEMAGELCIGAPPTLGTRRGGHTPTWAHADRSQKLPPIVSSFRHVKRTPSIIPASAANVRARCCTASDFVIRVAAPFVETSQRDAGSPLITLQIGSPRSRMLKATGSRDADQVSARAGNACRATACRHRSRNAARSASASARPASRRAASARSNDRMDIGIR